MEVCYYTSDDSGFSVYEFGYSELLEQKTIHPYVRNGYILHIVLEKTCRFCDFDVSEGEAFLIAKNKLHSFTVPSGYKHCWFVFDGEKAEETLRELNIPLDRHSHLKLKAFPYIKELLLNAKQRAEGNKEIAKSALCSIFPLLITEEKNEPKQEIAEKAKRFMDGQYQRAFTMEDVAKHCFVSEKYLCCRFKERYGMPPKQYLVSVRMKRAKKMLMSGTFKVKEVAASVGYPSQLAFSGAFKKYFGKSPAYFVKNIHQK